LIALAQPFFIVLYLYGMKSRQRIRLEKERRRWALVAVVCALSAFAFSSGISSQSFFYHVSHPLEIFKLEQENPFQKIYSIFKPYTIPEKFREFN
jgi:hypothetical protein